MLLTSLEVETPDGPAVLHRPFEAITFLPPRPGLMSADTSASLWMREGDPDARMLLLTTRAANARNPPVLYNINPDGTLARPVVVKRQAQRVRYSGRHDPARLR